MLRLDLIEHLLGNVRIRLDRGDGVQRIFSDPRRDLAKLLNHSLSATGRVHLRNERRNRGEFNL